MLLPAAHRLCENEVVVQVQPSPGHTHQGAQMS